jgi:hypothetical protein
MCNATVLEKTIFVLDHTHGDNCSRIYLSIYRAERHVSDTEPPVHPHTLYFPDEVQNERVGRRPTE